MLMGMAKPLAKLISMLTPKRRWAQFSLLTLFVVVTVLCVWLAIAVNRSNRRRAAIIAINRLGGWVRYDFDGNHAYGLHASLRVPGRLDGLFRRVVEVKMWPSEDSYGKRGFLLAGYLPFATEPIDNDGLRFVAELKELERLSLMYTDIGDKGLVHLRGLTRLQELRLRGTLVTDAGVAELQKALPNCEIIR